MTATRSLDTSYLAMIFSYNVINRTTFQMVETRVLRDMVPTENNQLQILLYLFSFATEVQNNNTL